MKRCTECHSEVEPGWQYCHTCGEIAQSTVYRIVGGDGTEISVPHAESVSVFTALLEGRPIAPLDQVYVGDDVPAMTTAPIQSDLAASTAAAAASLTSALPLTPHVLPEPTGRSPWPQRVAAAVAVVSMLALGGLSLHLRSDLGATRARLQTTQEELDRVRSAVSPR